MSEAEYLAVLVQQNNAVITFLFCLPLVMCVCLVLMDMVRS